MDAKGLEVNPIFVIPANAGIQFNDPSEGHKIGFGF
jgi:hypothetical protein